MKLKQRIIFWPGYYRSSLCYVSWDAKSNVVLASLSLEYESVYSVTKQGIVTGDMATKLSAHFSEIERLYVFESSSPDSEGKFDAIDKVGILISAMFKKLKKEVKEQLGAKIPKNAEFQILDFYGFFQTCGLRLVNTLAHHLSRSVAYTDAMKLLDQTIDKKRLGEAELFVMADEGQGTQTELVESRSVQYLNIGALVSAMTNTLKQSGAPANVSQLLASELGHKLKTISEGDWLEVSSNGVGEHDLDYWVVDRLHLDLEMEKSCKVILDRLDIRPKATVFLVGSFTDYAAQFLGEMGNITLKKFDREAFIKLLVSSNLLCANQTCEAPRLKLEFDGEQADKLIVGEAGFSQEYKHTLKFFGRDSETVSVELCDDEGRFLRWDAIINTNSSLDICEIPIQIIADTNSNFDCIIDANADVYVSSLVCSVYDNARLRPISNPRLNTVAVY